jgi:hypothetical protein
LYWIGLAFWHNGFAFWYIGLAFWHIGLAFWHIGLAFWAQAILELFLWLTRRPKTFLAYHFFGSSLIERRMAV